jgi:prevent-host-death family protein
MTVSSSEARRRFGHLLERVARGEEIVITRHDKPVARIVPEGRDLERVRKAVDNMRRLREDMAKRRDFKPLTDKEIKDAINEGRRWPRPLLPTQVAIAWVVTSQSRPETDQLAGALKVGTVFVVPVLWIFEVAEISKLAVKHELSLYDSVFASLDSALNKAARAAGVRTLL